MFLAAQHLNSPCCLGGVPDFKSPGEEEMRSPTSKAKKFLAPESQD